AKTIYISAKTGQRTGKLFDLIHEAHENAQRRIPTGLLNECLHDAVTSVEPPSDHGRRLKIFYVTQGAVEPPTFILFVNDATLLHFSYRRYLENFLRRTFDFAGTPIKMIVRERNEERE
ncbi:MAG: ribosome biogenesis GTPase Der, partial [Clostridia bacterium]|nr:ribosome biogenesis GTPase Der [Clostridia bacterium]